MILRTLFRLLFVALISCAVAPAYAGDAAASPVSGVATASAANVGEIGELKDRVKELEARELKLYEMELENERKAVDWWLSYIGVLAAIMAIAGGFIPYLMGRKDKEIIELDRQSIRQDKESIEQDKRDVEQDKAQVRAWLDEIERLKDKASEDFAAIHKKLEIVSGSPGAVSEDVQQTAKKTAEDETADPLLRLRAKAVEASRPENAREAYTLWATLSELEVRDANAQFNAGYWGQQLGRQAQGDEKLRWLRQAGSHYAQAFALTPNMHDAVNNWGVALDDEARALAAVDLAAARELWRQAGDKFWQALDLKQSNPDAAYNWGLALAVEAGALAATDLAAARELWRQAGEKYRQALDLKRNSPEAVYNWGLALAKEAEALSATDLAAARELWREAGEKYRQALALKPDEHEAANSWGYALLVEATAVSVSEPERSSQLLEQAEQLLLQHVEATPGVVAYNLACVYGRRGDVQRCLHWLRVCQEHGKLPDCEHVRKDDKDLDPVRNDPEFIAWLQQACPSHEVAVTQDNKA